MKKKTFAFILALIITISSSVFANSKELIFDSTKDNIISNKLKTLMTSAKSDDKFKVDIWVKSLDNEYVEQLVKNKAEINREDILVSAQNNLSSEEGVYSLSKNNSISAEAVDNYLDIERKTYSSLQNYAHLQFINDYKKIDSIKKASLNDSIFISQYAPVISVELSKFEIETISKDHRIEAIYYSPVLTLEDQSDISYPLTEATLARDSYGFTGQGVRIGMIESGLPNRNNDYFTSGNITYDPNVTQSFTPHANLVASIMVARQRTISGTTYRGIAPNALLFATRYDGTGGDWRARVEWLIAQGVHVINMSARLLGETEGSYGSHERWLDHVAINHSVHFVHAAGNNGGNINSPGMAYNIITVGAIDDRNTPGQTDDILASYSSRTHNSDLTNKPDIVAPGSNIRTAANTVGDSGTSFAAPHVTGIIAQLLQQQPSLRTLQDGMKAILTAGIKHPVLSYGTNNANFSSSGAGLVNAQSASWIINSGRYITSSFAANSANGSEKSFTFNVSSSDTLVRISMAWLRNNQFTGSNHTGDPNIIASLPDLDVSVYDANNNLVDSALSSYNNLEVIRFVPSSSGRYTIRVRQHRNSNQTVYFGLAWW